MAKYDGGSAFPHEEIDTACCEGEPTRHTVSGMSLRAWFAGQIMAGFTARPGDDPALDTPEKRAAVACRDADALIAELVRE